MSSIHIVNRCTKTNNGGGLPFYKGYFPSPSEFPSPFTVDNILIFSAFNQGFNTDVGLWYVPAKTIPTFQLFLNSTVLTLHYMESLGAGKFTGVNFIPVGAFATSTPIKKDGVQKHVYGTIDTFTLSPPAPFGRYIIRIETADFETYYSEEFITKDC